MILPFHLEVKYSFKRIIVVMLMVMRVIIIVVIIIRVVTLTIISILYCWPPVCLVLWFMLISE